MSRLAGALVVVLVVATGIAGYAFRATTEPDAPTPSTVATATARVVRTDLVQTETLSGTLGFAEPRQVLSGLQGIVTALPEEADRLERGSTAFEVDGSAVVVMTGSRPAWRSLAEGVDDGADVEQLEQNLRDLGFGPEGWVPDKEFDADTADAVEAWREDVGLPEGSEVELGRVLFLPDAVRVGAQAVDVGSPVTVGSPVFEASSFTQRVVIDLDPDDIDLVSEDTPVEVVLPDDRRISGRISAVGRAVKPSGPEPGAPGVVEVDVELDAPVPDLDTSPVDIEVESERASGVLAVPVRALLALSDGGYAVEVDGSLIQVETGDFAGGLVEVSGAIEEGDEVVIPR